ncbi:rhodanese-like domain-containing protein [Robertkochia solimangrovi]|uniref:rhodanese-like domain-containing protein n=1 Tax=Robertkochia solimangrovi TaxID=2213046 RepID=UPI0011811370|nr:rhodanese-like domain-containing protein [Robertkochia solimangrovi]TRZ41603.1 hypothetical protein DMZ48_16470 [Robertkochia solimangrovi]
METQRSNVHFSKELITQVTADELDGIIASEAYTIIDVRSASGIASQGNIPTAVNVPLEELKRKIDERSENPDSFLNSTGPFLFCCTGGVISYMAAIHAQESGMQQVFNLEGGHAAWKKLKAEVS